MNPRLFIVYRTDRSDGRAPEIRARTRPAHRQYMDGYASRVRLGGPMLDGSGNPFGGLMIIEADSEEEVRAIVAADPFERESLSDDIRIHEFRWQTKRPADLPPL